MKPKRKISKLNARIPLMTCLICSLLLSSCNEIGRNHLVASSKIKDLSALGSFEFHPSKGDREISLEERDDIPGGEEPEAIPVNLPNKTAKTYNVADEFMEQLNKIKVLEHQNACSLDFPATETRFVRIVIKEISTKTGTIVIDEFEVFGPDRKENLALASRGAVADVSSMAEWNKKEWLNDGIYGDWNASWYADVKTNAWMQIQLPGKTKVNRITISRDRLGNSIDCIPKEFEVLLSKDGHQWTSVARWDPEMYGRFFSHPIFQIPVDQLSDMSWDGFLKYTFLRERSSWSHMTANDHLSPLVVERTAVPNGEPYWGRIARLEPLERVLVLFEEMIERFETKGLDVTKEQILADKLRQKAKQESDVDALYLEARRAKRDLFFRDPDMAPVERVLFAKRHPYLETHNYSEHLDGILEPGGGVYVLNVPRDKQGRFRPEQAKIEQIFDGSQGVAREPVSDFDAGTIYFAYRPDKPEVEDWESYWHMYSMKADGSGQKKLTDGPFHDFDGVCLPDGGLAFHSTRCKKRFICWRPQAYVLHRMEADGSNIQALSFANLTEWKPSVMQDGRILWTRSEYLDKGANFGHTLWAIRPDGTHPELVFGNNTPNCYSQAHEVPGTNEIVATLMTHGGHSGPIALIDRSRNKYDTDAITNITPDNNPFYEMGRPAGNECESFRDPYPISSDLFLVAHNSNQKKQHYDLYVMDRYGNRELLYADPGISSFFPSPFSARQRPPVIPGSLNADLKARGLGQFIVQDVYMGLGPEVERGKAKYIRISEEVPSTLDKLSNGQYRDDHEAYTEFYAAWNVNSIGQTYLTRTTNAIQEGLGRLANWIGPSESPHPHVEEVKPGLYNVRESWGWPSYSAKASHGTVPVAEDGSANFLAPAGKVLYFHLLDAEHNEIQRMRSVIQLQPGEIRSCIGCHEDRQMAPPANMGSSIEQVASHIEADPWGTKPFSYQEIVQPVLNKNCVSCHDGTQTERPVLTGMQDQHHIPASYRALLEGGYIHYFAYDYNMRHFRAEPLSFGTLKSSLWTVLEGSQHDEVTLEKSEIEALKTWTDLNCPLWPDYTPDRPVSIMYETADK